MTKKYATPNEIIEAFKNLSSIDMCHLHKVAGNYCDGTRYSEPNDLIHEVLHRCLTGTRKWPKGVKFPAFMTNAMRSLSRAERYSTANTKVICFEHEGAPEFIDQELMCAYISHIKPEDILEATQRSCAAQIKIKSLKDIFYDDPVAQKLILGWLDNEKTRNIRVKENISLKEYEAARKRIIRSIGSQCLRSTFYGKY